VWFGLGIRRGVWRASTLRAQRLRSAWTRAAVVATVLLSGTPLLSLETVADVSKEEVRTQNVLRFFDGHRGETISEFLMRHRPSPLDASSVSQVFESLPEDMKLVRASKEIRKKIVAAQQILEYSARSGVITIRVIASDIAFAALYFRAVLLISTRALDILSAEELAAVTAHEIGHDFEWTEYWNAIQRHDYPRTRELELRSDGFAVLTLEATRITPERLVSAAIKMTRCNEWQAETPVADAGPGGDRGTRDRYVPLKERIAFIRAIARLEWADQSALTNASGVQPLK
jgi:hypothetical protein